MVQLQLLNGRMAGLRCDARRFPFRVGRSSEAGLSLLDDGVWEFHLTLELDPARGAVVRSSSEGFVAVNGHPVSEAVLRSGDILEAGSVKMRVGLSSITQYTLRLREVLTWVALGLLCLGQVVLVYWLMELG